MENSLRRNWMPRPPLLSGCLGIQFLINPYAKTVSPSLCSTYATYRTPCHVIGHHVLPTQRIPREAEDFPRGDKYFKHVPPLTYLIYFSPKVVYMVGPIYVSKSPNRTLIVFLLVLNQHFQSPIYW